MITEQAAAKFAFGKAGQVLLSFRELGAIGVLDPDSAALVWATRGRWLGQHPRAMTQERAAPRTESLESVL